MAQRNQQKHSLFTPVLCKRTWTGAAIALVLICVFLLGVDRPDPAWPEYWYLQPLLVLPFAGATGGVCYHVLQQLSGKGKGTRVAVTVSGILIYLFGLWMGTVLGLHGTLWH